MGFLQTRGISGILSFLLNISRPQRLIERNKAI
jgi:hypothetical protein